MDQPGSEPFQIQGVGGTIVPPPEYFGIVYDIVRKAGGLCIADEVQAGFGRTGEKFWGFENFGITPDIEQGPDGNLYVVSNTDNAIYKISRASPRPGKGGKAPDGGAPMSPAIQAPDGLSVGTLQSIAALAALPIPPMGFGTMNSGMAIAA